MSRILFFVHPDGTISTDVPITNASTRIDYERPKGPKVLNEISVSPTQNLTFRPDDALRQYDVLVAIDTNRKEVLDRDITATGIVVGQWVNSQRTKFRWRTPYCILMTDPAPPTEPLGWSVALSELMKDGEFKGTQDVGVVVDSDLSSLARYNTHETSLAHGYCLPPLATLLYASADVGTEFAANFLIRRADRVASRVLRHIEDGGIPVPPPKFHDRPFTSLTRLYSAQKGSE